MSNEDDFEKYLEVYEIIPADINEAKLGYDKDDFEDMDTLKVLRILSFRLTILRRAILCSLMTIPAEGTKFNLDKWNSVTEMMHNLGSATGEASERINQILTKEDREFILCNLKWSLIADKMSRNRSGTTSQSGFDC